MPKSMLEITGDKKLAKAILALPDKVQKKVVRSSLSRGLTPIARTARKNQQHKSLKKLIGKSVIKRKRDKMYAGKVYMKPSKDRTIMLKGREVGFEVVGNILEFGSAKRNIKAQPFMRPAAIQSKGAALHAFAEQARKKLKTMGAK